MIDLDQEEILSSNSNTLGFSISGLYANAVFNGHNMLFFCISALFLLYSSDKKFQLMGIVSSAIIIIGLFYCQQRGAFFISIVVWLFIIYRYFSTRVNSKLLTLFLFIILLLVLVPQIMGFLESSDSRLISDSDSGRGMLLRESINYYLEHPLFGGYAACIHQIGMPSHNLLVSAFLAGGFFGGVILLILIFKLLMLVFKNFRQQSVISPISLLVLGLITDSMVHNTGFVEGDPSTFLSMALLVYAFKYKVKYL